MTSTTAAIGSVGDQTACALATRVAEQILDVLTARTPLSRIRSLVSMQVAGLLSAMVNNAKVDPDSRLQSVHACLTTSSKVEVCAVLAGRQRTRSLTMRLEQRGGEWTCTLLTVL